MSKLAMFYNSLGSLIPLDTVEKACNKYEKEFDRFGQEDISSPDYINLYRVLLVISSYLSTPEEIEDIYSSDDENCIRFKKVFDFLRTEIDFQKFGSYVIRTKVIPHFENDN
jgi:hypothetical protein